MTDPASTPRDLEAELFNEIARQIATGTPAVEPPMTHAALTAALTDLATALKSEETLAAVKQQAADAPAKGEAEVVQVQNRVLGAHGLSDPVEALRILERAIELNSKDAAIKALVADWRQATAAARKLAWA